ncbi:MAG: hypothetical protein ACOZAO_00850 [Patescibacteria group bacterium]
MFTRTKVFGLPVKNRLFAMWALMQLAAVLTLTIQFAQLYATTSFDPKWKIATSIFSIFVIYVAYLNASRNDGIATSFLAVVFGALGYGMWADGITTITPLHTVEMLFALMLVVAGLIMMELIKPGIVAKHRVLMFPALVASVVVMNVARGSEALGVWDVAMLIFFSASVTLEYERAWNREHNIDNAIDFSLEFMVGMFQTIKEAVQK